MVRPRSPARSPDVGSDEATSAPPDGRATLRARQWQAGDQVGHDLLGGAAAELGLGGRHQAVREHGYGQALDVVRGDVVAPVERGGGAGGPDQVQGGARRGAQAQLVAGAGGADQVDGVAADRVGDVDGAHQVDQLEDVGGVRDGLEVLQRAGAGVHVEHRELGLGAGVADRDPGHEAVALASGRG